MDDLPSKTIPLASKSDCAVMGRKEEAHDSEAASGGRDRCRIEGCAGHRASVQDRCRKLGISDATFYKWRTKYAGLPFAGDRNPGQRTGILRDGVGCVNRSARSAAALYSAGKAGPERVY